MTYHVRIVTESEQRQKLEEWLNAHPYGDQDENGIDLSLLRANLRLTPRQRLEKLEQLLRTMPRGANHIRSIAKEST